MKLITPVLLSLGMLISFSAFSMGQRAPQNTWSCQLQSGQSCNWESRRNCLPGDPTCNANTQEWICHSQYSYSDYMTNRADAAAQVQAKCLKESNDPNYYCKFAPVCRHHQ